MSVESLKHTKYGRNVARLRFNIVDGDFALSQDAAAILGNVTVQTLNNWNKLESAPPRNADGTYSARQYGAWLSTHRGKKKVGAPAHAGTGDRNQAEARLKEAQAIKAERENDVAEGLLIPIEDVESAWQDILMRVRSRLLKMPTALATILVGDTDIHSVQTKVKDAVYEALTELSEDWRDDRDS